MASTLDLDKAELIRRAKAAMKRDLPGADYSVRESVALACRILHAHGHGSGLAGHVTARLEGEPGRYLTQRLGLGLDEITSRNLLVVNDDLDVVEGEGMANPANRFHVWIYRNRPDVRAIVHTHPMHISALAMLETPLQVSHMDTCMLYDDVGFLGEWPGVPVGNGEGEMITATLGNKRGALLSHHGLVAACASVQEACLFALQMERAAELQLKALSAGEIREIAPELAREAHDWVLQPVRVSAGFAYLARAALRADPSCLD